MQDDIGEIRRKTIEMLKAEGLKMLKAEGLKMLRTSVDISSASRTFELVTALHSLRMFGHAINALEPADRRRLEFGPALVRTLGLRIGDLAEWLQGNPGIATALPMDRLATLTRVELEKALYGDSGGSAVTSRGSRALSKSAWSTRRAGASTVWRRTTDSALPARSDSHGIVRWARLPQAYLTPAAGELSTKSNYRHGRHRVVLASP